MHDLAVAAKIQAAANVHWVSTLAALAIVAGESQADNTADLVGQMEAQADQSKIIAQQAVIQAGEAKRLAPLNFIDTLKNTQDAFQAEQRAWIGVQDAVGRSSYGFYGVESLRDFFSIAAEPQREILEDPECISPLKFRVLAHPAIKSSNLFQSPLPSIAPQGRYNLDMGTSPPAHASTGFEIEGAQTLISQYPQIRDGKL